MFGVRDRIRTDGFTVLQTVPLDLSGTLTLFGSPAWVRSTDLLINSQTLLPTELLGNKTFTRLYSLLIFRNILVSYFCVRKLTNPVSAAHPVFASAEAEYGYRSALSGAG